MKLYCANLIYFNWHNADCITGKEELTACLISWILSGENKSQILCGTGGFVSLSTTAKKTQTVLLSIDLYFSAKSLFIMKLLICFLTLFDSFFFIS